MEKEKKNSRQLQAEQTKGRIFEAALSLLDEMDFDFIRIQDIVGRAEVSVGAFYVYYQSKIDVFYQTYSIADAYFQTEVEPKLTQASAKERILTFFREYALYSSEITNIKLTKLLYSSNNKHFNRDNSTGMFKVLADVVSYGMEKGELNSEESPEDVASFLFITARGLVYNWCINDGDFSLADTMVTYINKIMRCL